MARYRGTLQGCRGEASRLGTTKSSLVTTANGWNGGIRVTLYDQEGEDHARIILTTGSGYSGPDVCLYDGPINQEARENLRRVNQ